MDLVRLFESYLYLDCSIYVSFFFFLEVNFDDNQKEKRLIQWESSISDKCTAIEEEKERHKIENLLHENTEKYFCLV